MQWPLLRPLTCLPGGNTSAAKRRFATAGVLGHFDPVDRILNSKIFLITNNFPQDESGIVAWVTIHSYALMWMFPWGYTEDFTSFTPCVRPDDYDDLVRVAKMTAKKPSNQIGLSNYLSTHVQLSQMFPDLSYFSTKDQFLFVSVFRGRSCPASNSGKQWSWVGHRNLMWNNL